MSRTRTTWTIVALAVVILLLAAGAWYLIAPKSATASSGTQLTSTVQQGQVSSAVTATGNIAPVSESNPTFAVSGTVKTINVSLGQTVKAGQKLGTLDPTALQATLATAQTALADDQTILDNAETALTTAEDTTTTSTTTSTGGGSSNSSNSASSNAQSVDSAEASVLSDQQKVASDEATVTTDQQNVNDTTLTAPISGLVVAIGGTVGQSSGSNSSSGSSTGTSSSTGSSGTSTGTSTGTTSTSSSSSSSGFVTIADTSKMTVTTDVAEADIADVAVGQAATVTFPALSGTTAAAKVTAIAPTGTTSNSIVTFSTTITLDAVPKNLRIGQTADVSITTRQSNANALYIPAAAITTSNGTSTVKVVSGGKTSTVTVKTGVVGTQGTEITSGLTAGETIVLGTVSTTTTGTGTTGTGTGTGTGRRGFGTGTGTGGFGGGAGTGTGGFGGTGTGTGTGGGNR